jgi:3-hydroxyisobutyrate dehydrogenase
LTASAIGFLGLGHMGLPMARRLRDAGHDVRCYDVTEEVRRLASADGLMVVDDITETVTGCRALILMLPNSDVVESVLLETGLLAAMRAGGVIVDMGSSRPTSTRSLAARAAGAGVGYVDAPVSGGVSGAESGNLTIMVGGDDDHIEPVLPLLVLMGKKIKRVGPSGAGHALKALNNLMSATHLLVSSEALLAGHAFGLDFEVMLDAINTSSGRSGSTEVKWPNYVLPGSYDSGFGLALMAKDMSIAVDLIHGLGWPSPVADAATAAWRQAVSEMSPGADHTTIVEWLRMRHDAVEGQSSDHSTVGS